MRYLRPTESPRHFELLVAFAAASSRLAAAFFSSAELELEPRPEDGWFAAMAAIAKISDHVSSPVEIVGAPDW